MNKETVLLTPVGGLSGPSSSSSPYDELRGFLQIFRWVMFAQNGQLVAYVFQTCFDEV
jgi:hypothetical protein